MGSGSYDPRKLVEIIDADAQRISSALHQLALPLLDGERSEKLDLVADHRAELIRRSKRNALAFLRTRRTDLSR